MSETTWKHDAALVNVATRLREKLGDGLFTNHNIFLKDVAVALKKENLDPSASDLKLIINAVSWRVEGAPPVIKKIHKAGKVQQDTLHGFYSIAARDACLARAEDQGELVIADKNVVVEYEPDSELRDYEQVPLLEPGGVEAFIRREVLPYTPDAWIVEADTKIGYEVSFTRHFYQPPKLRTLAEISEAIALLEDETKGLLTEITGGKKS